jgi:peptide/nickel transport system ATP-binding protein
VNEPLLDIEGLHIEFRTASGLVRALNGVSLQVWPGEVFGLVGETGCGKSITGLSVLRLLPKSARIPSGRITFEGRNILDLSEAEMQALRGRRVAMIFQDPSTALNPVFTIGNQIEKIIAEHLSLSKSQIRQRALETLAAVGLPDVERIHRSYPHQLSGGMQQRVVVAFALSCQPSLIIADEPTTALDVTIQSQILELLADLQKRLGIAMILITHNLGVVAETCNRLAVLYAGKVVETGLAETIFERPMHPYTRGLMAAIPMSPIPRGSISMGAAPTEEGRRKRLAAIPGTVPVDPGAMQGCVFAPRCAYAFPRCHREAPPLYAIGEGQRSACFLSEGEANG